MTTLDALVAAGPDPEGAAPALARFLENGGVAPGDDDEEGQALLVALLSNGSYLANLVLSDVDRFSRLRADPFLRRPKPDAVFAADFAAATAGAKDFSELCARLRRAAKLEMLRLGAREVGWGTTLEVAAELSGLADACLDAAIAHCEATLRAGYGPPTSASADDPPSFVVLGMGKLGGRELNFSSDIDLIYVYSTDDGAAGTLTLHEYYARLSQMVTRAISETTGDGMIFRVDLRLRPEGRSGAICNSVPASERYYETFGRTWERQALLRARPCAGDRALGARLLSILEPFVHPRTVGPNAAAEVKALRALFRQTAEGRDASAGGPAGFNVKLGAGGIRDCELVAQLLQLLHAGKRRDLRERATLPALHKLMLAGLLSDGERAVLSRAYRFWRRIEHRVQLENGLQTHELPADAAALARLARRLGGEPGSFAALVRSERAAVRAISDTLGEPEGGPPAIVLRLLDAASPPEQLAADLTEAGFRQIEESARVLDGVHARLPPAWLAEAIQSPDPDRALARFSELVQGGSLGLLALLNDDAQLLGMLASLFGTSDRLSRHLLSHPAMWATLVERVGEPHPTSRPRATLARRLADLGDDYEEALREMRRYQAEEILRIGIHDVSGNLMPSEVSFQLAALAEACLGAAVDAVVAQLRPRYGLPDAALTILAMGSFGAYDMRYGSDLDLVFLFSAPGATDKGMDNGEWFGRLAQRLISALGALMSEGRLYEVDTRLRPSGSQGMLVTSYASFDRYHQEDAAPWERVALLRSRAVYQSTWPTAAAAPDFARLLEEIQYERPLDEAKLRDDLRHMRGRIENERIPGRPGTLHLRFSPGGLTDLEMIVALGQLLHGHANPRVRAPSLHVGLERLQETGVFQLPAALLEDDRFLQRASLRLRLLRDQPDDRLLPDDLGALARSLELSEEQLVTEARARMARVRGEYQRVFGGSP